MNNLPRVATRQCGGRESNLLPADCKSSALTTTLPRHIADRWPGRVSNPGHINSCPSKYRNQSVPATAGKAKALGRLPAGSITHRNRTNKLTISCTGLHLSHSRFHCPDSSFCRCIRSMSIRACSLLHLSYSSLPFSITANSFSGFGEHPVAGGGGQNCLN